jgi:hypothetical protein
LIYVVAHPDLKQLLSPLYIVLFVTLFIVLSSVYLTLIKYGSDGRNILLHAGVYSFPTNVSTKRNTSYLAQVTSVPKVLHECLKIDIAYVVA